MPGRHKCREQWPVDTPFERIFNIFLLVVLLALPLAVLFTTYSLIARTLWQGIVAEQLTAPVPQPQRLPTPAPPPLPQQLHQLQTCSGHGKTGTQGERLGWKCSLLMHYANKNPVILLRS